MAAQVLFLVYLFFPQNITTKAASIVEPFGFSGSLPIMFFFLCYILYNTIVANNDVLFCLSVCFILLCQNRCILQLCLA